MNVNFPKLQFPAKIDRAHLIDVFEEVLRLIEGDHIRFVCRGVNKLLADEHGMESLGAKANRVATRAVILTAIDEALASSKMYHHYGIRSYIGMFGVEGWILGDLIDQGVYDVGHIFHEDGSSKLVEQQQVWRFYLEETGWTSLAQYRAAWVRDILRGLRNE